MTTFEALVTISQMVLCARGQWHDGATAYADIEAAVSGAADLIRGEHWLDSVSLDQIHAAIAEIKRRSRLSAIDAGRVANPPPATGW